MIYTNPKNEFEREINFLFESAKNKNYNVPMQFVALNNLYEAIPEDKRKEYVEVIMIVYRNLTL